MKNIDIKTKDTVDGKINLTLSIEQPKLIDLFSASTQDEIIQVVNKYLVPELRKEEELISTTDPVTPYKPVDTQFIFSEDLQENMPESTPSRPHVPLGLSKHFTVKYKGAFRVSTVYDPAALSSSNYAVGALGYNPKNNSLFMAGHAHHNAIAEFAIPAELSFNTDPNNIVNAEVLQNFSTVLDKDRTNNNKITGMLAYGDKLLVTSEIWYDTSNNKNNMQVLDISDISKAPPELLQLEGGAKAAGYMSRIPSSARPLLGADYLVGWASNYSITSRYSQGPSLFTFDPQDAITSTLSVPAKLKQVYNLKDGEKLHENGNKSTASADELSPLWTNLSRGMYGFIVPDTHIFMVVGSTGGLHGGMGYKITQDTGNICGGGCTKIAKDNYNYFWLYDLKHIVKAKQPWNPRPISYGKWMMPHAKRNGDYAKIIGASFDETSNTLYMSLAEAGRVGNYDRPPLIVTYELQAK